MAIITDIIMQSKNKKRVNLYLDGRFECGLEAITVLVHSLKVGMIIDNARLEAICVESETATAFDRAIRYLAFRLHSKQEIEKYLYSKGYLPIVVTAVIDKLIIYKYIDDYAFAVAYVESYKKKNGKRRLRYDLDNLGIEDDVINEILTDLDSSDEIDDLIQKKYKGDKRKLIDFLIRRGFEYDDVILKVEKFVDSLP